MERKNSHHVKDENQVPFQKKKSALPLPVRKISKRKILGPLSLQPFKKETGSKKASAQAFCANETSAHLINEKSLEHASLLEEQQADGIDFQVDASSLKSILDNVGIQATRCPIGSSKKNPQAPARVLVEGAPLSTPLKVRNSVYCQGPTVRMSLAESCRSYQKKLRTEAGLEEASASPKLLCTPKSARVADSPLIKSLKSEKQPRSVYPKYSQRFLIKDLVGSSVSREDCPSTPDLMQKVHTSKGCHSLVKSVHEASWHTPLRVPKTPSNVTMASFSRIRCDPQTSGRAAARICATESRKIHQRRLVWADILSSPELPLSTLKLSESTPEEDFGSSYRHETEDNHDRRGGGGDDDDGRRPGGRGAAGRRERGHGRTAQGARQPRTARAAADDDDSSPAVTHPPAWSQRSYYYHGHYHLYSSSSNNSSSETGALSGGCAATQVVRVNSSTAPGPPAFTPATVAGGGDNGVAAGGEGRREVELRRRADAVPRPAGGSADGDAALLVRLQALKEEENRIQNEMQLLTMAMQREHEGDSNGNHLKSTTASSTGTTASTVCQCPPAARPAAQLDVQLDLECPERSLTISAPSSVSRPCELQNAAFQTDAGINNSGVLCSQADINCNPLDPAGSDGMEEKDAANDARGGVGGRLLVAHALTATQVACGGGSERDDGESGDDSLGSCNALYRLQTSILVSTTTTLQADHSTVTDSVTSLDTSVVESTTGGSPHHKQLTTNSRSPNNRLAWQINAQPSGSVASRFAAVSSWPQHPSARHSVDMETDDQLSSEHDAPSLSSHADVQLVTARAADAKARDSHELPHHPGSHGEECSTPVLITPVSLVPSSADRGRCESLRMTPPIWTALALRLAASTQEEAPAGRQWRGTVSHRPAASRLALPCLAELEDVVKAMNRSVSLSPKLSHKVSPSKRAPMISPNKLAHKVSTNKRALTRRNRSASPASPLSGSIAARSPRRARLRRAEAASGLGTALREVDVFLEALLEDECALYAGRLQAFFRHDTACDRTELPDPVAKILNEGDDMHFVPIRQEAGLLAAVEGSAFSCYIPT